MAKITKTEWLLVSGLEEKMDVSDLLTEIAAFMNDEDYTAFYNRLMEKFDWIDPKEYDKQFVVIPEGTNNK